MFKIRLKGLKETEDFGIRLGKLLKGGDIVSLTGDLGTGKTTFTKSIGKGLGVDDYITSPTFTLINEYEGRYKLYHFDVYRLENVEELEDLGFEEYFYSNGVTIVEWGDKIDKFLPRERIQINIEKGKELDERIFNVDGEGERYKEIIKELSKN